MTSSKDSHIENIVKRLQLRIFAEGYKNPNGNTISIYAEMIDMINNEYNRRYANAEEMLDEDHLVDRLPVRVH